MSPLGIGKTGSVIHMTKQLFRRAGYIRAIVFRHRYQFSFKMLLGSCAQPPFIITGPYEF